MVGILAQVDDIFSWASRGGKRTVARWVMRIQGHGQKTLLVVRSGERIIIGYLNILCRCTVDALRIATAGITALRVDSLMAFKMWLSHASGTWPPEFGVQ